MSKRIFSVETDRVLEEHDFQLIHRHILKICKHKYDKLEIHTLIKGTY